ERALARQLLGRRVVGREHVQLRRLGRGAEGDGEAAARLVEAEPVQDAAGQLAATGEDAVCSQAPRGFVEARFVDPGAAVDVEDGGVALAREVLQALQLAGAAVLEPLERDR